MALPSVFHSILNQAGLERLEELGVESTSDLANIFSSERDIFDVSADAGVVQAITQAWHMARVMENVRLEQMPAYSHRRSEPTALDCPGVQSGAGLRPKMRCRPPAQLLPKPFRAGYAAPPLRGLAPIPDKRLAALKVILEVVLASGSENTQFGPELRANAADAFELFAARFRNVVDARLQSHVGAFKRWVKWHSAHVPSDIVYWKPSAFWVARYLADVSKGGPTASCHAFASLKWWSSVVGLPLPMADGLVLAWASPTAEHVVQPRTPLSLGIFWAMLRAWKSASGTVASFLTWTLLLLIACLRFEHSRRSHSLRLQDGFIRATCAQGKRRVQGRRPPFDWAIPARITQTIDLSSQLFLDWAELQEQLGKPPTFIVQDLDIARGQPLSSAAQKIARPMTLPKFNCLLRRFMPTAADVMQFQPHECQAIGNWVELPQTDVSSGSRSLPVVGMAKHYAHDKTSTAAFVKQLHAPSREAILQHLQSAEVKITPPVVPKEVVDYEKTASELPWFAQTASGKKHLVQSQQGVGLDDADEVCQKCWARAPIAWRVLQAMPVELRSLVLRLLLEIESEAIAVESHVSSALRVRAIGASLFTPITIAFAAIRARCRVSAVGVLWAMAKSNEFRRCPEDQKLPEPLIAWCESTLGIETLSDFCNIVTVNGYESELDVVILSACEDTKAAPNKALLLARLRAAWRAARASILKVEARQKTGQPVDDLDDPLDPATQESLLDAWRKRYNLELPVHMAPSDTLLGRVWREMQRGTVTVIGIDKVRSLFAANRPQKDRFLDLGSAKLQLRPDEEARAAQSVAEYYQRLRVLCNAYTIAGTFKVDSKQTPGTKVFMAPLGVLLDYCDAVLRHATDSNATIEWLKIRDEQCRARMVELARQQWPLGEAFFKACQEQELMWQQPPSRKRVDPELHAASDSPPSSKKAKTAKEHRGRSFCKRWNDQRDAPKRMSQRTGSGDDGSVAVGISFMAAPQPRLAAIAKSLAKARHVQLVAADNGATTMGMYNQSAARDVKPMECAWPCPSQVEALIPTEWVYYCGVSPLPQTHWSLHDKGPIFVISLFDGIGAAFVALLALGVTFRAVAVEMDPVATGVCAASFRNVAHFPDARSFTAACLRQEFQTHAYAAVLVLGGSPCQDISRLNRSRKGLNAPRTQLFAEIPRVAQECRDLLASLNTPIPVLQLLENVAHGPTEVMTEFCAAMQSRPLIVHGSSFGWVRRTRMFWGGDGHAAMSHDVQSALPKDIAGALSEDDLMHLRWVGKKPWPARVFFQDGFKTCFQPQANIGTTTDHVGFATFTRSFEHPRLPDVAASDEARRRYQEGERAYPAFAYEDASLLWKGREWRQPNAQERATLMGIPSSILQWAAPEEEDVQHRERVRASLIGNSFHVPSLMVVLMILLQMSLDVQQQFVSLDVQWPVLQVDDKVRAAVRKLQIFKADCILRNAESDFGAPQWRQQNHRALAASALGAQRGGPLSKIACQPLIPEKVDKATHMALGTCLPSPYDTHAVLDPDASFAVRVMVAFGPCIRTWRRLQQRAIRTVHKFLSPWDAALRNLMPEPVFKVASDKCPAMMTAEYTQELLDHTVKEIEKGWADGLFTRQELDEAFGHSCWLPMQRFMHVQACGKQRPIDNGRSNGHNALSWMLETICTNTPDFAAAACRALMDLLHKSFDVCPAWAQVVFGTEDMDHAYRQMPNMPEEAPGLVVGIWHPTEQIVKYAVMRAHPFGLASAVLNFCRLPTLATAATRQWTGTATAGYFDDSGILDAVSARGSGQESLHTVYGALGVTLDAPKRQPMSTQRTFLGVLLNLAGMNETATMFIDVKPGLRETLMEELDTILSQNHLSSGQASKLRGKFQWASSAMYGRCARGGQGPLVRRQYEATDDITPELARSLKFMRALLDVVGIACTIPKLVLEAFQANVSDGLSRGGTADDWTRQQDWLL
ncbi:DNMT3A, partial [Symbiodinium necroappetens]